jgi:microcystin-dependent protein
MTTEYDTIQIRRDKAANWILSNPVLAQGEQGLETDTGKVKIGDGLTHWLALAYFPPTLATQWIVQSGALTYVSGTQFKIAGNLTATMLAGVRVQAIVTAGTIYGSISSSSAGGSPVVTTVNVTWDSGALDAGLSQLAIDILSFVSISVPASLLPPGIMMPYAGTAAPSGWLLCYGQTIPRLTYSTLYSIIGTTFGAGDGLTTFNLPDMRGRQAIGIDNLGGVAAGRVAAATLVGQNAGAETHTHAGIPHTHLTGDVTLTVAQSGLPEHAHNTDVTDNGGAPKNRVFGGVADSETNILTNGVSGGARDAATPHNHGATGYAGAITAAESIDPYLATSYIIKT